MPITHYFTKMLGIVLLCSVSLFAQAQAQALQQRTFTLQHQTAQTLERQLRPLLNPGDQLIPLGSRLVIRAQPQTLSQIEALLTELDRAPVRLRVSLRYLGRDLQANSGTYTTQRAGDAATVLHRGSRAFQEQHRDIDLYDGHTARLAVGLSRQPTRARAHAGQYEPRYLLLTPELLGDGRVQLTIRREWDSDTPIRNRGGDARTVLRLPLNQWQAAGYLQYDPRTDQERWYPDNATAPQHTVRRWQSLGSPVQNTLFIRVEYQLETP